MSVFLFISFLLFFTIDSCCALENEDENKSEGKRLLIGNEFDISEEFIKLSQRLDQQQKEIQNLTKEVQNLNNVLVMKENELQTVKETLAKLNTGTAPGSTYTRWGKSTCPGNGTSLLYKGYMGGTAYTTSGGGANYLCLTEDPQWDHYDVNIHAGAKISGVEYEFYNFYNQDGASQFFGKNIYNDDAPCAVCHSARGSSVMIPGRTECYGGWTKEYSGYIVAEYDSASVPSEWICLDRRPDIVVGGKTNDDEGLLYMAEASCGGSLECPPYIDGREITCVVCTK